MRPSKTIYPVILLVVALAAGCGQDRGAEETTNETTEVTVEAEITSSAALTEATNDYEGYVADQASLLEKRTKELVDAVIAGDVDRAKELYAPARVPWERIEPVAGKFGDYDPRIDAHKGDVPRTDHRPT